MKIASMIASMILIAFGAVVVGFTFALRSFPPRGFYYGNEFFIIGFGAGILLLTLGIVFLVYSLKAKKSAVIKNTQDSGVKT